MGKQWKRWQTLFFGGSKITADGDCSHEIKRRLFLGRKVMTNLDSIPVVIYRCDSWTIKKAEHFRIYVFETWCWRRLLRVLWTARRSNQSVHPKGNQSWIFNGRTDAEGETSVLWPPDAGRDWEQEEKGMTEHEMAGWHQWLEGHESGWTPGVGNGQGGLACCDSWGCKEWDTTEQPNWTELTLNSYVCEYLLSCTNIMGFFIWLDF